MESTANRNLAYQNILDKLPEKRKMIYNIVANNNGITSQEISDKYNLPINQVVGRVYELKERFLIKECGSLDNHITQTKNTRYKALESELEHEELKSKELDLLFDKRLDIQCTLMHCREVYSIEALKKELKRIEKKINILKL